MSRWDEPTVGTEFDQLQLPTMKAIILATVFLASEVTAAGAFGMATGTTGGGTATPAAPSDLAQYVTGTTLPATRRKIY